MATIVDRDNSSCTWATVVKKTTCKQIVPFKKLIEDLFRKHFIEDKTEKCFKSTDRLLEGQILYDSKVWVTRRISRLWFDIFNLYGWEQDQEFQRLVNFRDTKRKIAIEVQNNWKSNSYEAKNSKFMRLENFKKRNPEWTVIVAAINDVEEKNTVTRKGIHILTGDKCLEFMLGKDWRLTENLLKDLMRQNWHLIIQGEKLY